jgi:hypothetical protein
MSTTLPALTNSLHELPFGAQSQLQTSQGRIAAFLAYAGYDAAVGTARYALRVLNNTPFPARARLFVETHGVQNDAYPLALEVAPFSMRDDVVTVRLDVTGPFDRAIVEVSSEETYFTVEAPPPPLPKRAWQKWLALGVVPAIVAAGISLATPRVLAITAPARALAGTTVQVPLQVSGAGSVEYDFRTRDGQQLAAGLTSHSSVLQLAIPQAGAGAPYTLHVRMRNPFASAQAQATIGAIVVNARPAVRAPAAPGSLIGNLAVAPSPARAGQPITVSYSAVSTSGDVWLVGMDGRTWARGPLSAYGSTQLKVPQAAAGQEMRVVLHVQRGKAHAQSAVGISVLPDTQIASAPTAQPATPASSTPDQAASIVLNSQVVSAGDAVVVRANGTRGDVKITVTNSSGATVEQGNISDAGGAISITAPDVSAVTTFFVVGTFSNGVSQQSIVRRLVVTPR